MERSRGKNPFKKISITKAIRNTGVDLANKAFGLLSQRRDLRRQTTGEILHPGFVSAEREIIDDQGRKKQLLVLEDLGKVIMEK